MINFHHKEELNSSIVFKSWRPSNLYCYSGGEGTGTQNSTNSSNSSASSGPTLSPQQILSMYGTALPSMANTATNAASTTASPALTASQKGGVAAVNAINLNGLSPGESNAVERSNNQTQTATGNLGLINPTNTISNALNFGGAFNSKIGLMDNAVGAATGAANASTNNLGTTAQLFQPVSSAATTPTFSSTSASSGKGSGSQSNFNVGCFLTTVCCEYKGLPDDCEELNILRNFRDTFVPPIMKEEYYRIAPNIVVRIKGDKEALEAVYECIQNCVKDIKEDRKWSALIRYRNMITELRKI